MGRREGVLIIDENREIVKSLKVILEQKYQVLTAYDGIDGLKVFEEHHNSIDIVISDLVMPDLSGTGVISFIKKRYPGVPIIAITGWVDEIGITGSKVKPDRFIKKPFDICELEQSMAELLAEKEATTPAHTNFH
jgi:two-component system cell cycle sensor histidine kinase/response regulator CckA